MKHDGACQVKRKKISLGAANTKSAQLFYISPPDIDHKSEFNLLEIIEEGPQTLAKYFLILITD